MKSVPLPANLQHIYNEDGYILPALPEYADLFGPGLIDELAGFLHGINLNLLPSSLCEVRDVCRIPLKPDAINDKEFRDLSLSLDGLR